MCGIFSLLNVNSNSIIDNNPNVDKMEYINSIFMQGINRGPEFSKLEKYDDLNLVLGFHRLAINGLNSASNQPLCFGNIKLICNGEIYNYKQLYNLMNISNPISQSDCEVIIHLYIRYGIEQTLTMLDGVFAFILIDDDQLGDKKMFVARDPYGVRPLYSLININNNYRLDNLVGFASELKLLAPLYSLNTFAYQINQFQPGTYSSFKMCGDLWEKDRENVKYHIPTFNYSHSNNIQTSNVLSINYYLKEAVNKRCLTTERPVACLLSGGLDSSLIAALVNDYYKSKNQGFKLETYSIGLEGSEDLKYAKIVADHLDSNHHEIIVTENDMFNAIPEVIKAIESYDTTTVRASIGNYLIGKYIKENSQAKVIFNGDGSDELFGGYLYMNNCPDDIEFDKETRRLLKDIYLFDVLRSDKCISSHGLEPRTPFLDRTFVNHVLSLPSECRNHKNYGQGSPEKIILRNSFRLGNFKNYCGERLLPHEILWRKKEAFSDGVSSHGRSLYQILQEKIANKLNEEQNALQINALTSEQDKAYFMFEPDIVTEKHYYIRLFKEFYPKCEHILPYYWMPKYTDATDPSARTLEIYKK